MRSRTKGGKLSACAISLVLLGAISPGAADILEADFTGTTGTSSGFYSGFGCTLSPGCVLAPGTAFTATFVFDTDRGALYSPSPGTYELYGGTSCCGFFPGPVPTTSPLISASLTLAGVGTFTNSGADINFLLWHTDSLGGFNSVEAFARDTGGFREIALAPSLTGPFLQTGPCPGSPCAMLGVSSASLTDLSLSAVPGPIAGAGLPGLVLACGGLLGWWRRRRQLG
jgi:hypothetical protein